MGILLKHTEPSFALNPAHAWYLELPEKEREAIHKKFESQTMEMNSGKQIIEYLYEQSKSTQAD